MNVHKKKQKRWKWCEFFCCVFILQQCYKLKNTTESPGSAVQIWFKRIERVFIFWTLSSTQNQIHQLLAEEKLEISVELNEEGIGDWMRGE